ncbi:carbon storage regulator CsrA [Thermoanaerobacterium sp. DL9XJH110]|uniref:carbon storage regulator CsrA n=1 Tax=Thermoanaerobacterium sp. DL9XJH110 TaxID=3386643 RepID=UPI003BB48BAD
MLVLTRKIGESLLIGSRIKVTVIEIEGDRVKLAVDAPKDVKILREELYCEIAGENKKAASVDYEVLKDIL